MANIVCFHDQLTLDNDSNLRKIISKAKKLMPFGPLNWDASKWDVTSAFAGNIRPHEIRTNKYLHFYPYGKPESGDLGAFTDAVKALVSLRYQHGLQGAANQKIFVDAWRYICETLNSKPKKLRKLSYITAGDLDLVCNRITESVGEGTANNLVTKIHEIAALLDENRLVREFLDYRYAGYKRPKNKSGINYKKANEQSVLEETNSSKMVSEEVQQAIGKLYQMIPAENLRHRLSILAISIATCIGRRIGEILSLQAKPVQYSENNKAYVEVFTQKRSQGNLVLVKEEVYLIPQTVELVNDCINELLVLTSPAREVARRILEEKKANIPESSLLYQKESLTSREVAKEAGFKDKSSANSWLKSKGILPNKNHKPYAFDSKQILAALNSEANTALIPVLVTSENCNVMMNEHLFIATKYQLEANRTTQNHTVRTIRAGAVSDSLKGRESHKKSGS